jgi:FAD/FMN-containing dehydrogenase
MLESTRRHHFHPASAEIDPARMGVASSGLETAMATPAKTGVLDALDHEMRGELITPSHPGYDAQRRVWNGSIDRRPTAIARCSGPRDVAAALRSARRAGLPVAVRSGGHSFPGDSVLDDGLVIDLSPLKGIEVDAEARSARVGAGVLVGELDRQTQEHGLGVTGGIVSHTGMAGLTLGGGLGWLMRAYGLTVDQLVSAELVTANGELLTVDAGSDPELFWGLRGGGGNFGVVTEFTYRLHPVGPTVLAGPIFWPMQQAPEVLRFYRDWIAEAPDELMTIVVHRRMPQLPIVPEDLWGQPVVAVIACYIGPVEEGERLIRPVRSFGHPLLDACAPKPYVDHQAMFDPSYPHGWWYYMRSCDVAELTDEVIDLTVEHASQIRSPRTAFPIWQLGGARARVAEEETAFSGRSAGFTFNVTAGTEGPDGFEEERAWVRRFWDDLQPHSVGAYVNFLMDEGQPRVRQAYGEDTLARLRALKRRLDPENVFRHNQNIPPEEAVTP